MKYDDAEYYFLNFTTDLPNEAGGRHIGLFLEWAILRGLGGSEVRDTAAQLLRGELSPSDLIFDYCDGKLMDSDLSEEGNAFAASYYETHHLNDIATALNVDDDDDDALFAAELTPQRHRRVHWQLDQRYSDWRRQFGLPGKEALLQCVLTVVSPVVEAAGFARKPANTWSQVAEYATFQREDAAGEQTFNLIAVDHPASFYGIRVAFTVHLQALYDKLCDEMRADMEVPVSSLQYAAEIPFVPFAQGWNGYTQTYINSDAGFWIWREEDIEPLAQWLAQRLSDFALPLLRRLNTVESVAQAYAATPLSASPIYDAASPYAALLAAEMAHHPRLDAMLDETERMLQSLPQRRHLQAGALKLIARIRARRGAARPVQPKGRGPRDRW